MTEHDVALERSLILEGRPCITQRVLKDWPANEPDVDPAQAPAADARYAHRRAVRRPWLGFRGQVRWLSDDRGNPEGQGGALQPQWQDHQPQLYRGRQSAGGREGRRRDRRRTRRDRKGRRLPFPAASKRAAP